MEMILTGRPVTAKEALTYGLVNTVVASDEAVSESIESVKEITENVNKSALAVFIERIKLSSNETHNDALTNDQIAFDHMVTTEETKAAISRYMKKNSSK
jgi:enoyl-CoA hydratase/carnithine racemase